MTRPTEKLARVSALELDKIKDCALPRENPYMIQPVIGTIFSVARFYGGAKVNGDHYTYIESQDALVRDDVLKWLKAENNKTKTNYAY